jgi:hypothetical protein
VAIYDPNDKVPVRVTVTDPVTGAPTTVTSATLTVTNPVGVAGTPIVVTVPTTVGVYDFLVDVTVSPYSGTPGQYVWRSVSAGTIVQETDGWFVVRSRRTPGPVWTPELDAVGDLIPARTLSSINTPGLEVYLGTFTATTTPTDDQARRHVDAAVAQVLARCGVIDPTLNDYARVAAATRAAATIELAYPTKVGDLNTYDRLWAQSEVLLTDLADNNTQSTGAPVSLAQSLMPQWSYPVPVPWGDRLIP